MSLASWVRRPRTWTAGRSMYSDPWCIRRTSPCARC